MTHLATRVILDEYSAFGAVLDAAFSAERDPLAGGLRDPHDDRLFTRIVLRVPAPIGVAPSLESALPH